jgi:septum formation protein
MIVLASRSPRRAELLRAAGYDFVVRTADVDETPHHGETPRAYVLRLAIEKACAVHATEDQIVLGADTSVMLGSEIMGKPVDAADAARMLRKLSGKEHEVLTGVCVKCGTHMAAEAASTKVWIAPMSEEEIAWYVESGEPVDKAGAYAIQGLASRFVERIDGSYSNVVGLPITLVRRLLGRFSGEV